MHPLFTVTILLVFLALPAQAAPLVTGTGDPAQDVANVQAAVDKGGTVHLRGTFDFGTEGRVKITRNVRILGQDDGSGEPLTTIRGGFWTLYAPLPHEDAPPAAPGPIITVRGLLFDGARGTPLHFPYAGGLEIAGCEVTDVIPQDTSIEWSGGDKLAFQAGIVIGNRLVHPKAMFKGAVTGTVLIAGNRLEMINNHPDMVAGYGVLADWTTGADMTIRDNIVTRVSRNGIEVLDNALDAKGKGAIVIRDNRIATDDEGIEYPHKFGPNGIVAGWYFDTAGGADFSRNNRIAITGNRVEGRGENSTGLLLYANDVVATCNDVIMAGGSGARGIVQTGSRGFFANNRVRGKANYAVYCYPFEALQATANTFAWTDLGLFTGARGQVLLGGKVNVVVGSVPSLIDKGQGNRVVETEPCSLPEADPEGESWSPTQ